jgi:hypothetical protein
VKLIQSSIVGHPLFDNERMLALVSLMRKSSRELEFLLRGNSMGRALPDGSRIRVVVAADDRFIVGQVLVYVAKDRLVVHRLVRSVESGNGHYLIARGDATVCCDLPVLASSVLGTVVEYSTAGPWQQVGPSAERWFGFRWLAFAISRVVGGLLKVSPSYAGSTAKRIIRIHGMVERATGVVKRRALLRSRAGAEI